MPCWGNRGAGKCHAGGTGRVSAMLGEQGGRVSVIIEEKDKYCDT